MGRHTAGPLDDGGIATDDALRFWGPERRRWTARRTTLTVFGIGVAAAIVITPVASAALGGGKPGGRPSGNATAVSGGSGFSGGSGSAASAGTTAATQAPFPSRSPSSRSRRLRPSRRHPRHHQPRHRQPSLVPVSHAPAHRALNFASSLARLPETTALRGSPAVAWADAALAALGAPTTSANVRTMVDWFASESVPHDLNNPLNLQTPFGGSAVSTADDDPPSDGIQAYPVPADFVAAFPIEMNKGSYSAMVAALKAGTGLEGSAATPEIASELSVYSGGGYHSIPGR